MINNIVSRIAKADDLKSVDALQIAINNGTIPGYIGVPMIAELVKNQKEAMALAAGAPTSTVTDQVLQEAQGIAMPQMAASDRPPIPTQVPPQNPMPPREMVAGIDAAQSNLPTKTMAGGGIVAFAGGGEADDEYDPYDDEDNEEYYADMEHQSKLAQLIAQSEADSDALTQDILESPESYAGIASNAGAGIKYKEPIPAGGSKGLMQKMDFVNKIRHLESRGRDYDQYGNVLTSPKGAMGSMQTMANTLRDPGFGVKPAQDNSVAEMNRVGVDYANAMLKRYGNEKEAAMAYNWGPGKVDAWIANGRKGPVPGETRQYASNFAEGGIVGLAAGGNVKSYNGTTKDKSEVVDDSSKDNEYLQRSRGLTEGVKNLGSDLYDAFTTPRNYDLYDMYQRNIGKPFARGVSNFVNEPLESQAARFRSYSMTPNQTPTVGFTTPAGANTPVPTSTSPENQAVLPMAKKDPNLAYDDKTLAKEAMQDAINVKQKQNKELDKNINQGDPAPVAQAKAEQTLFEQMQEAIKKREASLESEKSIDGYLALLQGFLGMMGGTSPYAMVNIGQGASSGINTLLAARKQTGLAERALGRDQMGLLTAQNALNRQGIDRDLRERALKNQETRLQNEERIKSANAFETARKDMVKEFGFNLIQYNNLKQKALSGKLTDKEKQTYDSLQSMYDDIERRAKNQVYGGGNGVMPGFRLIDKR